MQHLLLALVCSLPSAAGIGWQPSLDKALERAATEKKVVFLAVNMDGERANERMAEKVYADKTVVELAGRTLNAIASAAEHATGEKPCPRFPGITCMDHRRTDTAARKELLKGDAQGFVVAPQHVFLGPDGKVILSVPYEISAAELAWCFATALGKASPEQKVAMPAQARMPRRLILGGVYDPSQGEAGAAPPTHKEVEELIKELRKGNLDKDRWGLVLRLLLSDDPAAIEFIGQELKSGAGMGGGGRGGGGGGGGAGGGAGGGGRGGAGPGAGGRGGTGMHQRLLHAIGQFSPTAYWPLVADFLENHEQVLRSEAAVALEQIGTPEALKDLQAALAKEEDVPVLQRLLRAVASCGAAEPKVHALLAKRWKSEKHADVRASLLAGLGYLDPDPAVWQWIETSFAKEPGPEPTCAVCAMAISRDERWIEPLKKALAATGDEAHRKVLQAGLDVLMGGNLEGIGKLLAQATHDEIERERLFGGGPKR